MSNHTTICANVICAAKGKMNDLKLESSANGGTDAVTGTPLLTLTNTHADGNGPILKFKNDPIATGTSDNSVVGQIVFEGDDDAEAVETYGKIVCTQTDNTAAAPDSKLEFYVDTAGSTSVGLSLTSSGSAGVVNTTISGGHPTLGNRYNLIADAADDTTITSLVSGYEYYYGTTTGALGAADGNNAMTFKLPTPSAAGEYIKITNTCAAAHGKILGFVTSVPNTESITYIALDNGVFIESASTATGLAGTNNVFVKLNGSHGKIGDTYEFVSTSTTTWIATINGRNGLIATGDINLAAGNVGGYVS